MSIPDRHDPTDTALTGRPIVLKRALPLLVLLAGCGTARFAPKADASKPLTWALRNDLRSLDPVRANEENTAAVLGEVVQTLTTVTPDGKVAPGLAVKWAQDDKTLILTLGDATFSDGSPVTAADAKASLERAADPKLLPLETSTYLGDISTIDAPDPHTLVLHLKTASRTVAAKLASPQVGILPARLRNLPIQKPEDLIGSGPYRLTEYRAAQRTVLEPNPHWKGEVPIKRIEVIPITDASALLNRFRAGDVDLLQVASSDVGTVLDAADLKAQATLLPTTKFIYLLIQPAAYPPFRDPRVRRAVAMALDRAKLAHDLVRGDATPAGRILPTGLAPDKPLLPSYDPEAAKALLAQAGYPGGKGLPPLEFGFNEANRLNPLVDLVPTALRPLGITVRTHAFGLSFMDEIQHARLPLALSGWGAPYPDPQAVLSVLLRSDSATNYSGYSSSAFDAADAKADASGTAADYEAAEAIACHDVPILPLYSQPKVWLTSKRLAGVALSTYGSPDFSKAAIK